MNLIISHTYMGAWISRLCNHERIYVCVERVKVDLSINAHRGQNQHHNVDDTLQIKAEPGKYLIEKCQSEHYLNSPSNSL